MTGRVLVVGGTGPTGPHIVRGLLERGHDVTIFHRGTHEPPELAHVEHLHGDPHFRESIDETLAGREFDTVLAMYGRVKHLAPALAGRCAQFLSISGVPIYAGYFPRPQLPALPVPVREDHPVVTAPGEDPALQFAARLAEGEDVVRASHPGATLLRFPMLYGPNNARPHEWSVLKRVRDGRRRMILPDGGIQIHTRCAARNAAGYVLAAVDGAEVAAGQAYNCGDPYAWSFRQWAQEILTLLGAELEFVDLPRDLAVEATSTLLPLGGTTAPHVVLDIEKARRDLGYEPVVDPVDALAETLDWYASTAGVDHGAAPAMTDRFDYAGEDALIEAYAAARSRIHDEVTQHPAPPVHSMPHPKAPGEVDHRGR